MDHSTSRRIYQSVFVGPPELIGPGVTNGPMSLDLKARLAQFRAADELAARARQVAALKMDITILRDSRRWPW